MSGDFLRIGLVNANFSLDLTKVCLSIHFWKNSQILKISVKIIFELLKIWKKTKVLLIEFSILCFFKIMIQFSKSCVLFFSKVDTVKFLSRFYILPHLPDFDSIAQNNF